MRRHFYLFIVSLCLSMSPLSAMLPFYKTKGVDMVMKNPDLSPVLGCLAFRGNLVRNMIELGDSALPDTKLVKLLFLIAQDGTIEYAPREFMIAHHISISCWARIMALVLQYAEKALTKPAIKATLIELIRNELVKAIHQRNRTVVQSKFRQAFEDFKRRAVERQQTLAKDYTELKHKIKRSHQEQQQLETIKKELKKLEQEVVDTMAIIDPETWIVRQVECCEKTIARLQKELGMLGDPLPKPVKNASKEDQRTIRSHNNKIKACSEQIKLQTKKCSCYKDQLKNLHPENVLDEEIERRIASLAQKIVEAAIFSRDPATKKYRFNYTTEWLILAAIWAQSYEKADIKIYFDELRVALGAEADLYLNVLPNDFLEQTFSPDDLEKMHAPLDFPSSPTAATWRVLKYCDRLHATDILKKGRSLPPDFPMASGVRFREKSFPDCTENALRKLFNSVLWDDDQQKFDITRLTDQQGMNITIDPLKGGKKYTIKIHPRIIDFYKKYPTIWTDNAQCIDEKMWIGSPLMHEAWLEVVSGLSEKDTDHPIVYQEHTTDGLGCNLQGSWENFEQVLYHLTGIDSVETFLRWFAGFRLFCTHNCTNSDGEEIKEAIKVFRNEHFQDLRIEISGHHADFTYLLPKGQNALEYDNYVGEGALCNYSYHQCAAAHQELCTNNSLLIGEALYPHLMILGSKHCHEEQPFKGFIYSLNNAVWRHTAVDPVVTKLVKKLYNQIPPHSGEAQGLIWNSILEGQMLGRSEVQHEYARWAEILGSEAVENLRGKGAKIFCSAYAHYFWKNVPAKVKNEKQEVAKTLMKRIAPLCLSSKTCAHWLLEEIASNAWLDARHLIAAYMPHHPKNLLGMWLAKVWDCRCRSVGQDFLAEFSFDQIVEEAQDFLTLVPSADRLSVLEAIQKSLLRNVVSSQPKSRQQGNIKQTQERWKCMARFLEQTDKELVLLKDTNDLRKQKTALCGVLLQLFDDIDLCKTVIARLGTNLCKDTALMFFRSKIGKTGHGAQVASIITELLFPLMRACEERDRFLLETIHQWLFQSPEKGADAAVIFKAMDRDFESSAYRVAALKALQHCGIIVSDQPAT